MDKRKLGLDALVNAIGKDFCEKHKDTACFACETEETESGLWCFLGIDLHAANREITLTASLEEWDVYATCYVKQDGNVVLDECRLPTEDMK